MSVLRLERKIQSCVMFWIGPGDVWKASNPPRFTGGYDHASGGIPRQLFEMVMDFRSRGYQAEIISDQTQETVQKYWRAA
jgi:hypothetical protein